MLRAMIKDVKERGKLDLTECFIDGSFVIAKKGAAGWEKPSGARVQSSWQWQIALVFLSPYPLKVLRRMKSDWSKARSKAVLPRSVLEN